MRMPVLFSEDRAGLVERWIIAEHLTAGASKRRQRTTRRPPTGANYLSQCRLRACHVVPDIDRKEQKQLGQTPFTGLADRMTAGDIIAFLGNPHSRYPDGRMPRLPVSPMESRDIAAYLLLWSKPTELPAVEPPNAKELQAAFRKIGARDQATAAAMLFREKGCTACHTGLGESRPRDVPIKSFKDRGCVFGTNGVKFSLHTKQRTVLASYLQVAAKEKYPSLFAERQHRLAQAGCARCHQRDSDRPPPIEEIGSTLGGAFLQEIPYLRTPRLTNPHQKFTRSYLSTSVREGVSGLRWSRFSYRMPAFGPDGEAFLQALAEADGELPTEADASGAVVLDPTLGTLHGSRLVGFQGYACASCHVWNGKLLGRRTRSRPAI